MNRAERTAAWREESGRLTVLIAGLVAIVVMAVGVVVNASNAFLQRRSLSAWADGAVMAAAQNVDADELYAGSTSSVLPISATAARRSVADYAARNRLAARFEDFHVVSVSADAASGRVRVELAAEVPLVLMPDIGSVTITADAGAVAPIR